VTLKVLVEDGTSYYSLLRTLLPYDVSLSHRTKLFPSGDFFLGAVFGCTCTSERRSDRVLISVLVYLFSRR